MRFLPGIGATMRTFCASASARSSASAATFATFVPAAGETSYVVTVGPGMDLLDLAGDAVVGERLARAARRSCELLLVERRADVELARPESMSRTRQLEDRADFFVVFSVFSPSSVGLGGRVLLERGRRVDNRDAGLAGLLRGGRFGFFLARRRALERRHVERHPRAVVVGDGPATDSASSSPSVFLRLRGFARATGASLSLALASSSAARRRPRRLGLGVGLRLSFASAFRDRAEASVRLRARPRHAAAPVRAMQLAPASSSALRGGGGVFLSSTTTSGLFLGEGLGDDPHGEDRSRRVGISGSLSRIGSSSGSSSGRGWSPRRSRAPRCAAPRPPSLLFHLALELARLRPRAATARAPLAVLSADTEPRRATSARGR